MKESGNTAASSSLFSRRDCSASNCCFKLAADGSHGVGLLALISNRADARLRQPGAGEIGIGPGSIGEFGRIVQSSRWPAQIIKHRQAAAYVCSDGQVAAGLRPVSVTNLR